MNSRRVVSSFACLFVLVGGLTMPGVFGCSSQSANSPEDDPSTAPERPTVDPVERVDATAKWFPADTNVLVAMDAAVLRESLAEFTPRDGSAPRLEGLEDKLAAFGPIDLGIDLESADALILGGTPQHTLAIFEGNFEVPEDVRTEQSNGYTAYHRNLGDDRPPGELPEGGEALNTWFVVLDSPEGLAVFQSREAVEEATQRASEPGDSLVDAEDYSRASELATRLDAPSLIGFAREDSTGSPSESEPVQAVVGLGDSAQLFLGGPDRFLGQAEQLLSEAIGELNDEAARRYLDVADYGLLWAGLGTVGYHLVDAYLEAAEVSRGSDVVEATMPLPQTPHLVPASVGALALFFAMSRRAGRGVDVAPVEPATEEPEDTVGVAIAASDIPAGTPLREEQVTVDEVPRQYLPDNPLLVEDVEIYLGQPLGTTVETGEMILTSDFRIAGVDYFAAYAAEPISSGETIHPEMIEFRYVDEVPAGAFPVSGRSGLVGRETTSDIAEGERLDASHFD